MKWNCGPTWREKMAATETWHRWFAWHPVRIGSRDCRWLEYVERKGEYGYNGLAFEYRASSGKGDEQ